MTNTSIKSLQLVIIALLFAFALYSATPVRAVTISPLNFEIIGNPGDVVSNIVRIYNDSETDMSVNMEVQDFVAAGERGEVLIKESDEATTYSLEEWVTVTPKTFSIPPRASQMVEFSIRVPAGAEPGGHYATILASISGTVSGTGTGVAQKVGSLLLVNVPGEITENLGIVDFSTTPFTEYGPEKLTARFRNDGTVHLKPRGFVLVKNIFGGEVAKLDLPQLNVLPQSARVVDIPLKDIGTTFGRYEATLAAIYGATNEPLSAITIYWVIPYKLLAVYGGIILVLLILAYRGRKRLGLALRVLFRGEQRA